VDTTAPTPVEKARFMVRGILRAQGVSPLRHWWVRKREALEQAIEELIDAGEVQRVAIRGLDGEAHYALTDALGRVAGRRPRKRPLHVLSPFDNLVARRDRLRKLFGFDFRLECYHPAPKRRWGYFCLPILWGEQFIGRLDAKADRKARRLIVRKLMFEPSFDGYDAALPPLAARLAEFAAFNGCEQIAVEKTAPAKARAPLNRELKKHQ
jgi:uncharacterized protein YcaQ